jgi:hypothetical protein
MQDVSRVVGHGELWELKLVGQMVVYPRMLLDAGCQPSGWAWRIMGAKACQPNGCIPEDTIGNPCQPSRYSEFDDTGR